MRVSTGRPCGLVLKAKSTDCPAASPAGRPAGGAPNSIVIAPQPSAGIGPCDSVTAPLPTASMRACPPYSAAAAAAEAAGAEAADAAASAGEASMRPPVARRLASESSRNWPDTTTCWPACSPRRTSVRPPASPPVSMSTGRNPAAPSATITTLRRPVRITASLGTSSACPRAVAKLMVTNMPGSSRPCRLASSMRALTVRVSASTRGSSACTRPWNVVPGSAAARASTAVPGRSSADWLSGTSASAHTVPSPLMRNSVAPGITVMPSRTASSTSTPSIGATTAMRGCTLPLRSTRRTCSSSMPDSRMRWRAASSSPPRSSPCMRCTARNSSCAAIHSGT